MHRNDELISSFKALTVAVCAFTAVSLFWAIVLLFFLSGHGQDLTMLRAPEGLRDLKATEIVSAVVAVLAFIVASGSLWMTRHHNKISVRPKLSIVRVTHNTDDVRHGFYLKNHGLGPAIISEIKILVPNKFTFVDDKQLSAIFDYYSLPERSIGRYWLSVLPAGGSERVLWLDDESHDTVPEFERFMSEASIVVHYESLYEESFEAS